MVELADHQWNELGAFWLRRLVWPLGTEQPISVATWRRSAQITVELVNGSRAWLCSRDCPATSAEVPGPRPGDRQGDTGVLDADEEDPAESLWDPRRLAAVQRSLRLRVESSQGGAHVRVDRRSRVRHYRRHCARRSRWQADAASVSFADRGTTATRRRSPFERRRPDRERVPVTEVDLWAVGVSPVVIGVLMVAVCASGTSPRSWTATSATFVTVPIMPSTLASTRQAHDDQSFYHLRGRFRRQHGGRQNSTTAAATTTVATGSSAGRATRAPWRHLFRRQADSDGAGRPGNQVARAAPSVPDGPGGQALPNQHRARRGWGRRPGHMGQAEYDLRHDDRGIDGGECSDHDGGPPIASALAFCGRLTVSARHGDRASGTVAPA